MRTVLVVNSKGGCGKTTLATNLASYYARAKLRVTIRDHDPQGSSMQWLSLRPSDAPVIHGANAVPAKSHLLRTPHSWVPDDTELLIVDPPGGVRGFQLQEVLAGVESVLIPVGPSSIDVHATADFIKALLLQGRVRAKGIRLAVTANRVRNSMPVYEPLERFLKSLNLPLLSRIDDSDNLIRAAEQGLGVFEMDERTTAKERRQFEPIIRWLDIATPEATAVHRPRVVTSWFRRSVDSGRS